MTRTTKKLGWLTVEDTKLKNVCHSLMGHFFIFHLRQFEATVSWRSCTQLWRFKNTIFTYDRWNVRHVERVWQRKSSQTSGTGPSRWPSLKRLLPDAHAPNVRVLIIKYLHMIHEMSGMSKEFDKENPPRHQLHALTDELRRDTWKAGPFANVHSVVWLTSSTAAWCLCWATRKSALSCSRYPSSSPI